MIRRPPRSTPFPTRRSSDLARCLNIPLRDLIDLRAKILCTTLEMFEPEVQRILARRSIKSRDRKSTRLNSSHLVISYAVFCLKKKKIPYEVSENEYVYKTIS